MARKPRSESQSMQDSVEAILAEAMPAPRESATTDTDARTAADAPATEAGLRTEAEDTVGSAVPETSPALAPETTQGGSPATAASTGLAEPMPETASGAGDIDPTKAAEIVTPASPAPAPGPVMIETPPAPPPPPAREPVREVVVEKVGAGPLMLAGVLTAALAFAAAWVARDTIDPDLAPTIAAQGNRLDALEQAPGPDVTPLELRLTAMEARFESDIATLRTDIAAQTATDPGPALDQIGQAVQALDARLTALERAPAPDGSLSQAAIASWEAEIAALRATLDAQATQLAELAAQPQAPDLTALEERLAELTTAAEAELAATRTEAAAIGISAAAAAERAAIDRILAALDAGTPYDMALADLAAAGTTPPDALLAPAADGVATLAALQAAFPESARAALAVARTEGLADAEGSRFMAFLRNQFDIRSVTPRDGSDPDAILSRAEAALAAGRLTDTLAEVASLPEVVRAAMAGWTAQAETRAAALAAAAALSETLAQN